MFVTLEENSKTLKVWTNSYFEEDIKKKMESEMGEVNLTSEDFLDKINKMVSQNESTSIPFDVNYCQIQEHK